VSAATATAPHGRNWATDGRTNADVRPDGPTKFEAFVYSLGMEKRPDVWSRDCRIRAWAKAHKSTHYVPEWFLAELGIGTEDVA